MIFKILTFLTDFPCFFSEKHGINAHWTKGREIMNKKQAILLSLMLIFGSAVANDNGGKELGNESGVENNAARPLNAPVVEPGGDNEAYEASKGKKLAIHVYGGEQGERSAYENAKILANAFADRRFTDKPMYVTAVYEETGLDQRTGIIIYMDGVRYSKMVENKSIRTFTPRQVGGAIDLIAEDFVDKHGNHLVIPEGVEPVVVASIN
ncbi:MAG: hypothetical protein CMB80_25950 [Flammeovirgaceae bacterium]|nr:hypothetical protein [Flammeovirgaceae bacterium]|tara:strand:+ start:195 stop:821 length:627 start_codon:yes stop_codon:yes gene_type:complete